MLVRTKVDENVRVHALLPLKAGDHRIVYISHFGISFMYGVVSY